MITYAVFFHFWWSFPITCLKLKFGMTAYYASSLNKDVYGLYSYVTFLSFFFCGEVLESIIVFILLLLYYTSHSRKEITDNLVVSVLHNGFWANHQFLNSGDIQRKLISNLLMLQDVYSNIVTALTNDLAESGPVISQWNCSSSKQLKVTL